MIAAVLDENSDEVEILIVLLGAFHLQRDGRAISNSDTVDWMQWTMRELDIKRAQEEGLTPKKTRHSTHIN